MSELAEADWVKVFYSLTVKLLEHVRGQNLVRLNEVKCIDLSPLMTHTLFIQTPQGLSPRHGTLAALGDVTENGVSGCEKPLLPLSQHHHLLLARQQLEQQQYHTQASTLVCVVTD